MRTLSATPPIYTENGAINIELIGLAAAIAVAAIVTVWKWAKGN